MPALLGLLTLFAMRAPVPPGEWALVEILVGPIVTLVNAAMIWEAFQPHGYYAWGRYNPVNVTRSSPVGFWLVTACHGMFGAGGVLLLLSGLRYVFLWALH
jgi:hypothetical protein